MKHRRFKTAFVLGAGLGMRLRPLTEHCPKPLLNVGGRPVITYAMDHLLTLGMERFIVNTHHQPQVYLEKFPNRQWRGVPILFQHEPVLLDTAGGLKNIENLLAEDESIVCYNGDVLADFPLEPLLRTHERRRPEATLALRSSGPALNVDIDGQGSVCDLRRQLKKPGIQSCLFTGIYTIETAALAYFTQAKTESVIDVFLRRIVENAGSIAGIVIDGGRWHDIGSPEEYERIASSWPG